MHFREVLILEQRLRLLLQVLAAPPSQGHGGPTNSFSKQSKEQTREPLVSSHGSRVLDATKDPSVLLLSQGSLLLWPAGLSDDMVMFGGRSRHCFIAPK